MNAESGFSVAGSSAAGGMFRIRRILVPVDFSECSSKALAYAVPFARQFGAELVLLHVVVPYPSMPEMGPIDAETVQEARASLAKVVEHLPADVHSQNRLVTGMADVQIVQEAERCEADLVIIATHGRSGLARVLLGSTAERVVRHAHCPVLVVREQEHDFLIEEKMQASPGAQVLPCGG